MQNRWLWWIPSMGNISWGWKASVEFSWTMKQYCSCPSLKCFPAFTLWCMWNTVVGCHWEVFPQLYSSLNDTFSDRSSLPIIPYNYWWHISIFLGVCFQMTSCFQPKVSIQTTLITFGCEQPGFYCFYWWMTCYTVFLYLNYVVNCFVAALYVWEKSFVYHIKLLLRCGQGFVILLLSLILCFVHRM